MASISDTDVDSTAPTPSRRNWLRGVDRWLGRSRNYGIAIIGIALLQIALIFSHQPLLDEWQALQISLQSPDFTGLMHNLSYEGHPPLWYLLLRFVGLFLPYTWVLPATLIPIAAITHWAILTRAPFPRLERLLISAGELVMFEYLTISRSLSLGVMLIFLAAAIWKTRAVWIPIILLPMCDFQFGLFSLVMVALLWRERRLELAGFIAWGISGLLAAWSVIPAPDAVPAITQRNFLFDTTDFIERFGANLFPFQMRGMILMSDVGYPGWNGMPPLRTGILLGPLFVWFGFKQLQASGLFASIFISFVITCFAFNALVYPLQTRHLMLCAILLIFLKWRLQPQEQSRDAMFTIWLSISALSMAAVLVISAIMPFNNAAKAYAKIKDLGLAEKHWVSFPESRAQGISALSGIKFQRLQQDCMQQFIRWDYKLTIDDWDQLEAELHRQLALHGRFYMVTGVGVRLPSSLARPLAKIDGGYDRQDFYLTEIGPGQKEHAAKLRDCVPGQRPITAAQIW